jgi:hypothetical protein
MLYVTAHGLVHITRVDWTPPRVYCGRIPWNVKETDAYDGKVYHDPPDGLQMCLTCVYLALGE